ncbi:MAG: Gldg family protein [Halofilum sp. (in: g-proteobacteria)]
MRFAPGRRLQSLAGIALAGLLFVAVVLIADALLVGARVDLTEDELYTLSDATHGIVEDIDEPIELTLYFSDDAAEGVPFVRQYAQRVRELLEEYEAMSDGRIEVRTVDPKPLTEARDRAREHGLEPVPSGTGDNERLFLGLVATNQTDGVEVIEFFEPERERFLEYDISRRIWSLMNPDRPVVGVMSRLDITESYNPSTGKPRPAWAFLDRIKEFAEVREVETPTDRIDPEIDVLMLVHPRDYRDRTLYAVDQYLTHGGRASVFVDPVADTASGPTEDHPDGRVNGSDPGPLLEAWGVDVTLDHAVADPRNGLVVSTGEGRQTVHPGLLGITRDGLAKQDVVTAPIERVVFGSPGVITDAGAGLDVTPLAQAAPSAGVLPAERFVGLDDPSDLARGLKPLERPLTLAARLRGELRSAWPDGPPSDAEPPPEGHRAAASEPSNMVLFSDTDVLSDRLWVNERKEGEESVRDPFAGNGDMVANAVENLLGSDALIGIRGEGTSARPFTRVEELEQEAANQFREKEREVREALKETEERLEELRSGRDEGDGGVILSEEQQSELEAQRERRNRLRRELREVRQRLDARIESLGDRLRLLNIVVVPGAVALAALLVFGVRRRRRRRAGESP